MTQAPQSGTHDDGVSRIAAASDLLPLSAILSLAAFLRLWRLDENGFGREYYAAAVRSMSSSWHNFFYNAFDPAGFVSLDKPPVAIWLQVLGAKIGGFSAFSLMLPQVILGLVGILLVYLIVRPRFGAMAALVAAATLAISPANVAVDRSNNTESCLIVVLLGVTWLAIRAAETKRIGWFIAAMALAGIGFNVKMAAAVIAVPAIALVYFFSDPERSWRERFVHQALGAAVLMVVSLSWVVAFDLTPRDQRPYAGSTVNNSMIELALLHNGAARFSRTAPATDAANNAAPKPRLWDDSPPGPARLLRALQANQTAWLLPLALAGILFAWRGTGTVRISLAVWLAWLASYWLVFSAAGGPFHTYYLAALGPPLCVFAGIGAAALWTRRRTAPALVALAVIATLAWQTWLVFGRVEFTPAHWLTQAWLAIALLSAAAAILILRGMTARAAPAGALALALILPLICALSVVWIRPNVLAPVADLAVFAPRPPVPDIASADPRRIGATRRRLIEFLEQDTSGARFLVAVPNAMVAAPLIIATGKPVMAIGGYVGTDPILTPAAFAALAERGDIRFVMLGGFTLAPEGDRSLEAIEAWIRANGVAVDPGEWSAAPRRRAKEFHLRLGGTLVAMRAPELFRLSPRAAGH